MSRARFSASCLVVVLALFLAGCGGGVTPTPVPTGTLPPAPTTAGTPAASAAVSGQALEPDPAAELTTGSTARLSGGEFVGDQADLTVIEAVRVGVSGDDATYAFLVEITGLDADTFPYNLRDFRLIDDENFQYEPLFSGGEEPRLEYGDLGPDQKVRGWLTFEGPVTTTHVVLQYAPALALEAAQFSFLVPA